jgi:hypothetical protein
MTKSGLPIRRETQDDYEAISGVHALAFGRENESRLVERLKGTAPLIPELSLVAQTDGRVVGHVLFFPLAVADGKARRAALLHAAAPWNTRMPSTTCSLRHRQGPPFEPSQVGVECTRDPKLSYPLEAQPTGRP